MAVDGIQKGEPVLIIVKNTFIDVGSAAERLPRRSSSLPPSPSMRSTSEEDLNSPLATSDWHYLVPASKKECDEEDIAFSDHSVSTSASHGTPGHWREQVSEEVCEAEPCPPVNPEGLTPTAMDTWAPRLNSHAKPFQPWAPRCTPVQGLQPTTFPDMLKNTVMMFTSMITAAYHGVDVKAQAIESVQSWLVDVQVKSAEDISWVLDHAKSTLLLLAERSSPVYVLGYRAQPFQEKSNAFQAQLGIMQDQSMACWDAFSTGHCRRGYNCRWQHPVCTKSVVVAVRPDLGNPASMDFKATTAEADQD